MYEEQQMPADQGIDTYGQPPAEQGGMQDVQQILSEIPPDAGLILVTLASMPQAIPVIQEILTSYPQVVESLSQLPPQELEQIAQVYAEALQGGQQAPQQAPPPDAGGMPADNQFM